MRFFCGLDLAQASDYTASVLVERMEPPPPKRVWAVENGIKVDRTPEAEPPWYAVRGIHRYQRGMLYPRIVEDVNDRLRPLSTDGQAVLILDSTGVGRGVTDMFRVSPSRCCPVVGVLITAGNSATLDATTGYWHVPKRDLVAVVQALLQTGRLKIADVPERTTLLAELQNFQVKITAAANDTYGAWREGQHDDLVLALALSLWWAARPPMTGDI